MHESLQNSQMKIHFELLKKWRHAMDLVGPSHVEEHFIDAYHTCHDINAAGNWVDLGSGAGFPGIALAIYNQKAHVTLVESRQKRAIFLRRVLVQTQLTNATVFHGRTENLSSSSYDGVISRAYKNPPAYLVDAKRLLSKNGIAILLLGGDSTFETPENFDILSEKKYSVLEKNRRAILLKNNSKQC